jgi:hypothetical protein
MADGDRLSPWQRTLAASNSVASRLQAVDAPPFIGQLPLRPEERTIAVEFLRRSHEPFEALCTSTQRRPALERFPPGLNRGRDSRID